MTANAGRDVEKEGPLSAVGGSVNSLRESVQRVLKRLKTAPPYDPAGLLPDKYQRIYTLPQRNLHTVGRRC